MSPNDRDPRVFRDEAAALCREAKKKGVGDTTVGEVFDEMRARRQGWNDACEVLATLFEGTSDGDSN